MSDQLRDAQRAALVAYLIGNTTYVPSGSTAPVQRYVTDNDLYDDLLVDVDTSPSVVTSRLKLAMGSAQLFVQRCLLGLEQVTLQATDAENWSWMKRYRVWEANRQIFLYPENYIVPELRDDKTDLFSTLEAALSAQAVTADTVADAFNTYLEGLLALSNIEIVATYYQPSGDEYDDDILHVIGRTRGAPQDYYYRRRIGLQYWTELGDDHREHRRRCVPSRGLRTPVLPLLANHHGRERPREHEWEGSGHRRHNRLSAPAGARSRFAWSERKHDQWTGKKLALGTIAQALTVWSHAASRADGLRSLDLPALRYPCRREGRHDHGPGSRRQPRDRTLRLHRRRKLERVRGDGDLRQQPRSHEPFNPTLPDGTRPESTTSPCETPIPGSPSTRARLAAKVGYPPTNDTTTQVLKQTVTPFSLVFSRQTQPVRVRLSVLSHGQHGDLVRRGEGGSGHPGRSRRPGGCSTGRPPAIAFSRTTSRTSAPSSRR